MGLRQDVIEAPETHLAHDFAPGQEVLYQPKGGPQTPATVSKVDASCWSAFPAFHSLVSFLEGWGSSAPKPHAGLHLATT